MYLDYALKTDQIVKSCADHSQFTRLEVIKTPDHAGDLAFRTAFDFPTYIMLSHPICKFRSHRSYPVGEGFYIANLALVPVFFSSLNIMSVLKLWGERAEGFFNPANSPLADSSVLCWELPRASKPAEYSSMNFIVQNGSDPRVVDDYLTGVFEEYFRLMYWAFPQPGFSPSTHFLHGSARITSQVKISKSLYVIEGIEREDRFFVEGRAIEGTLVRLRGLTMKNGSFFFQTFPALIDQELANEILPRENLATSFLNGVVAEVTQKGRDEQRFYRRSLITIIADYGESYFDILTALLGMITDSRFSEGESLTEIGTVADLVLEGREAYLAIYRQLKVKRSISEVIGNIFQLAIDSMFPALIEDQGKLYFIHPLAWGLLKKWNLVTTDREDQKQILLNLRNLLKLSENDAFMKLYLDESADYFGHRGVNKLEFTKSVFQLGRAIRLLKSMRRIWESALQPNSGEQPLA